MLHRLRTILAIGQDSMSHISSVVSPKTYFTENLFKIGSYITKIAIAPGRVAHDGKDGNVILQEKFPI
jgi:hypothetical protein